MTNDKIIPIRDLATATWLRFRSHDIQKIIENDGRKYFCFRNTPDVCQDLNDYVDNKPLTLIPRFLLSEYRSTKSLLHQERIVAPIDQQERIVVPIDRQERIVVAID